MIRALLCTLVLLFATACAVARPPLPGPLPTPTPVPRVTQDPLCLSDPGPTEEPHEEPTATPSNSQ